MDKRERHIWLEVSGGGRRRYSTSNAPALLLLNPDSGHQESDQPQNVLQQTAQLWAFAEHCIRTAVAAGKQTSQ